jgi:hypothetical protein
LSLHAGVRSRSNSLKPRSPVPSTSRSQGRRTIPSLRLSVRR